MSTPTKQEHHGSERWDNPHHPQKDKKIEDKSQKAKGVQKPCEYTCGKKKRVYFQDVEVEPELIAMPIGKS